MNTSVYIAPYRTRIKGTWPFDIGDDPSFHSCQRLGGRLTWGVCRPDVRNAIRRGDIVVFISFSASKPVQYRLCAVATVERKISQTDIRRDSKLKVYQDYKNLLIQRTPNGSWEHHEPGFAENPDYRDPRHHKDWLWRMADRKLVSKQQAKRASKQHTVPSGFIFAENYVLFSAKPTDTFILPSPPVVATYHGSGWSEKWDKSHKSQAIWRWTLGVANEHNGKQRSLRIMNNQHPHRHIRWEMKPEEAAAWCREFIGFLHELV